MDWMKREEIGMETGDGGRDGAWADLDADETMF